MRSRQERERWSDLSLIEYGSKEWVRAWKNRARITGDSDLEAEEPETGEVWQYMGSVKLQQRWVHQFRHRCHPSTKERWYVNVPASPGWRPPDQDKAEASFEAVEQEEADPAEREADAAGSESASSEAAPPG